MENKGHAWPSNRPSAEHRAARRRDRAQTALMNEVKRLRDVQLNDLDHKFLIQLLSSVTAWQGELIAVLGPTAPVEEEL